MLTPAQEDFAFLMAAHLHVPIELVRETISGEPCIRYEDDFEG